MVLEIFKQEREEKDDALWDRWNWKKIVRTVFISLVAAIVVVCVALVTLLKNSSSFRQGVLAHAAQTIHESTGARVAARDFHLNFFPIKLDLYGVVVHGSEPEFSQPLLYAEHAGVEVKWSSLRYRRWNLRALVLEHPVVRYAVSASGESNLPQPESTLRNTAHVFDVAIEKVQIRGGEVYWNDSRSPLEAEMQRMHFTADYDGAARHYRSTLRYGGGTIRAGNYALLDHSLESTFELTPGKLTVKHLALSAGTFRLGLSGSIEDLSHPTLGGSYDAQLEAADLEPLLRNVLPVAGPLHLAGSFGYRVDPGHRALESLSLNGTASSAALKLTLSGLHNDAVVLVNDVAAKYKFAGGNAEFENIQAQLFGGSLTGTLSVHDVSGAAYSVFEARLKNASLEQLQKAAGRAVSPEAALSGSVQADAAGAWYLGFRDTGFKDMVAHGNLSLQGALGGPSTPLRAVIHAEYEAAGRKLSLHQSYLKTAQTTLNLDGTTGSFGDKSSLQVSLHSGNLHEVELLAGNFPAASNWGPWSGVLPQPAAPSTPAPSASIGNLDLYGTATFTAFITNSEGAPELKGQLEARNLRVKGTSWKLVHTDIELTPSSLTFSNASLETALPERAKLSESPRPTRIRISSLPFRRIEEAQANLHSSIGEK